MLPRKILVAHDFSEPANRALAFATELADQVGASIEVMHVHPDVYDGNSDPTLGLPWPTPEQLERYLRFLDTELARAVRGVIGDHEVTRHIVRGEPAKRIASMANELGADVVCLGSTGKGAVERMLLGSVSQSVLRASQTPVLTVH